MVRGWVPPAKQKEPVRAKWLVWLALLLVAVLMIPSGREVAEPVETVAKEANTTKLPPRISVGLPEGKSMRLTVTRERLLQGKMMVVDEAHPIPSDMPAPNTFGVLSYARGRIACREQHTQLGREALAPLEKMCVDARNQGFQFLTVTGGTRSSEQQRLLLADKVEKLSRDMSMEEAVRSAKEEVLPPGCSEHQLAWTVDIRICRGWDKLPDDGMLQDSVEGRWLLDNCWQYGFIQRWPWADEQDGHKPYCFRYVGMVHARLMKEVDCTLDEYLHLLREKGTLTLWDENGAPVLSAMCIAAGERHTVFEVPEGIVVEDASLDNTGWAILAFSYG